VKLDFSGRLVLVTGAGLGNGAALARGFAQAGAQVVLVDRKIAEARAVAAQIREADGQASVYEADVADADACRRLADAVQAEAGDVSVLVNNAGILIRGSLADADPLASWRSTLRVNLDGPFHMTLAFLDALKRSKGCILNVASIQSFVATPNSVPYTASKGGVRQLTLALATELAPHGVRVNAIAPGFIATPMTEATRADPAKMAGLLSHIPMKRYAEPEELVGPALFLCSDHASYVTGAILPVDGGYLAC
jgi:NAD(P)-dependent dehydrogenase (short-subunit alcohol dehydrogenase family)